MVPRLRWSSGSAFDERRCEGGEFGLDVRRRVRPGRMRPTIWMKVCAALFGHRRVARGLDARVLRHRDPELSGRRRPLGNLKRGGVTPTMVKGRPLTVSALPTGFAAPPR